VHSDSVLQSQPAVTQLRAQWQCPAITAGCHSISPTHTSNHSHLCM